MLTRAWWKTTIKHMESQQQQQQIDTDLDYETYNLYL